MAIAFRCQCGRALRASDESAGKRTKCPGCGAIVAIPAAGGDAAPAPAAPKPAAAGATLACECGKKIATKPEWAGKVVKCPGCDARLKVPGGPAAPAPAPKPVKRPAPPPPPEEDEDTGFGASDDDAEEEAPTPKKGKKGAKEKKAGSKTMLYAIGGGVAVLLIGVGVWFAFFSGGGTTKTGPIAKNNKGPAVPPKVDPEVKNDTPDPKTRTPKVVTGDGGDVKPPVVNEGPKVVLKDGPETPIDFVPADSQGFARIRVDQLLKLPIGADVRKLAEFPFVKRLKEDLDADLDAFTEVMAVLSLDPAAKGQPEPNLGALLSSKPLVADRLEKDAMLNTKYKKADVGGKAMYVSIDPHVPPYAIHFVHAKLILVGKVFAVENTLKGVASEGPLAPILANAKADQSLLLVGGPIPPEAGRALNALPFGEALAPLGETKTAQLTANDDGTLKLALKLFFADAAKADEGKKAVDGAVVNARIQLPQMQKQMPPENAKLASNVLKTIKTSVTDTAFDVTADLGTSLAEITKPFLGMLGSPQGKAAAGGQIATNNLKQLALAMHNHHDAFGSLPSSKVGGGLSWRVALLPFLDQAKLHARFKTDEAWDSPVNKALLNQMPTVFEIPTRPAPPGHTYFRVFAGPKTAFPGVPLKLQQIPDGTSNTFLIVEAADAVPWTQPEGLDPAKAKLGVPGSGFLVALGDASVRRLYELSDDELRMFVDPADAQPGNAQEILNRASRPTAPPAEKKAADAGVPGPPPATDPALETVKKLALAIHDYHDANRRLPIVDPAKPSWRVAILPHIGHEALMKRAKLDEPWDSPANKALLAEMPKEFVHPDRPAPPGHTYFRLIAGPKTAFEYKKAQRLPTIPDGTSWTLMLAEAADAVPWTKCEEQEAASAKFGAPGKGFVLAMFSSEVYRVRELSAKDLSELANASDGVPNIFEEYAVKKYWNDRSMNPIDLGPPPPPQPVDPTLKKEPPDFGPKKFLDEPKKVLEEPKKILEEPKKILEKPKQAPEDKKLSDENSALSLGARVRAAAPVLRIAIEPQRRRGAASDRALC